VVFGGSLTTDSDGDGYSITADCNDGDASVHPGAVEACDGVDNNCDGSIDEGCNVDTEGPVTSNVMAYPNPVAVNTPITLTAASDDSNSGGSVISSAEYRIDGGQYLPMQASDGSFDSTTEQVGATVPAFAGAGVHTVCVRVWDSLGNPGLEECVLLAVYDPNGGFVTGGGWINSPAGAYAPDPLLTGKANFGFVSKYQKGATIPTGNTEFQLKVANLNFYSNTYEWLVVAGARAQYKGTGTINGQGAYKFLLTAIDADVNSSDSFTADRFRIKIWTEDAGGTEQIVYDNGLAAGILEDNATTQIGGGSIVIHKAKN
jgi:hypothetical protein